MCLKYSHDSVMTNPRNMSESRLSYLSVDRDRLRERQRMARVQMNNVEDNLMSSSKQASLFGAPVKVKPSSNDHIAHEVRQTLGEFENLKKSILSNHGPNLIGVDQQPPTPLPRVHHDPLDFPVPTSHKPPPSSLTVIKQPNNFKLRPIPGSMQPPRPGQVRPYINQRVHPLVKSTNNNAGSHKPATTLGSLPYNKGNCTKPIIRPFPNSQGNESQPEVESILKEMQPITPLSAIAATPRKDETTTRFPFNGFLSTTFSKQSSLDSDISKVPNKIDTPVANSENIPRKPDALNVDKDLQLSLSEESDGEMETITSPVVNPLSPIESDPSEQTLHLPAAISKNEDVATKRTETSSSSDSDGSSESESEDSSTEDEGNVVKEEVGSLSPSQESQPSWKLSAYLKSARDNGILDSSDFISGDSVIPPQVPSTTSHPEVAVKSEISRKDFLPLDDFPNMLSPLVDLEEKPLSSLLSLQQSKLEPLSSLSDSDSPVSAAMATLGNQNQSCDKSALLSSAISDSDAEVKPSKHSSTRGKVKTKRTSRVSVSSRTLSSSDDDLSDCESGKFNRKPYHKSDNPRGQFQGRVDLPNSDVVYEERAKKRRRRKAPVEQPDNSTNSRSQPVCSPVINANAISRSHPIGPRKSFAPKKGTSKLLSSSESNSSDESDSESDSNVHVESSHILKRSVTPVRTPKKSPVAPLTPLTSPLKSPRTPRKVPARNSASHSNTQLCQSGRNKILESVASKHSQSESDCQIGFGFTSSESDNSDSENKGCDDESPPKLETDTANQEKKKFDAIRRLFLKHTSEKDKNKDRVDKKKSIEKNKIKKVEKSSLKIVENDEAKKQKNKSKVSVESKNFKEETVKAEKCSKPKVDISVAPKDKDELKKHSLKKKSKRSKSSAVLAESKAHVSSKSPNPVVPPARGSVHKSDNTDALNKCMQSKYSLTLVDSKIIPKLICKVGLDLIDKIPGMPSYNNKLLDKMKMENVSDVNSSKQLAKKESESKHKKMFKAEMQDRMLVDEPMHDFKTTSVENHSIGKKEKKRRLKDKENLINGESKKKRRKREEGEMEVDTRKVKREEKTGSKCDGSDLTSQNIALDRSSPVVAPSSVSSQLPMSKSLSASIGKEEVPSGSPVPNHNSCDGDEVNCKPGRVKQLYFSYFEKQEDSEDDEGGQQCFRTYLYEAKRMKHAADVDKTDQTRQAITYLNAALYFIQTGNAMEHDPPTYQKTAYRMYKDTLSLIKYISSRFKSHIGGPVQPCVDTQLAVLSLRCQAILNLKLSKMTRLETKDINKVLTDYFQKSHAHVNSSWSSAKSTGTPSPLSPTPSPAGSVGSVGSQSSGYNSSGDQKCGGTGVPQTPPHSNPMPTVSIPLHIYNNMVRLTQQQVSLTYCLDLWEQGDALVSRDPNFFVDLDHQWGPLTLHSSLHHLVRYVRSGLDSLMDLYCRGKT